ncbi:MAG: ATP-grasp domain-containing protein, partial [bacterium]|nr:ATP-grasp domain-containing protein [bacterium]
MSNENPSSDTGSSSPKLLFVHSGSPKKRLAFEAASALGIHIYLFNPGPSWADDYTKQSFYTRGRSLSEILSLAADLHEQVHLDGVVTFWEEDVPTCACISQHLGLPGNSVTAAMNARSKYHMREAFQQAGVPVPSFRLITDEESLENACREIGLPAVLKPEWGADSEWVTRVDTVEQALERYREIRHVVRIQDSIYPYPPTRFLLEGFLSGPEVSVEGVMQNGNVTLYAIIDKAKMSESFFIERGECTPSRFPAQVQEDIRDMVTRGAAALGLVNSGIHAEVKITPDGPRLVEIGARMGGDCIQPLVKRVYGIDLAVENINAAMGWPVHPPTPA